MALRKRGQCYNALQMTVPDEQSNHAPTLPLSGYRVLDLAGPMGVYCGKLLADMGADVIKVEPPGGDPMREVGPFIDGQPGPGRSLYWRHFNTNKRSVTLDINTPEGAATLRKLALASDVAAGDRAAGVHGLAGFGIREPGGGRPGAGVLFHHSLRANRAIPRFQGVRPGGVCHGRVYVRHRLARHSPQQAMGFAGVSHRVEPGLHRHPAGPVPSHDDRAKGQYIDVSMQEAVAATTEHVNTTYNYTGEPAVRCGFRHGGQFVATWRCADGYASITTNTRQAWDDLRAWMARDGMAGDLMDEQYNDHFVLRGEHSAHIEELIQAWALLHTRQEITEFGQSNHHPWGPAATADEILENEQLWGRGYLTTVESADGGPAMVYPGDPYRLAEFPQPARRTAPDPGEHNTEVLSGILGLS